MSLLLQGGAPPIGAAAAARVSSASVYRAVWRWHFYAGLLCLPFLISLSTTGALYLFQDEINGSLFAYRTRVAPQAAAPLGPDRLIFNALQAVPGVPVSYTDPPGADAASIVTVAGEDGRIRVYLNPYTGDVLDRVARDREFMTVVRGLHSLAYLGPIANAVIEVVAGFAVILVLTGVVLWWPRGQTGGVVTLRATPRRRIWWRDLHAVTGFVAGAGLLFLALTGLPWSIWWGQQLRAWSNAAGLGQPSALWAERPVSAVPLRDALPGIGWTLQDAPVPRSGQPRTRIEPLGIDQAAAILAGMGMPRGYELALPVDAEGVYAAAAYPRSVTGQRVISLDQYTGAPLIDVRFTDLGPVGQMIQFVIGLHKGEHWGRVNQLAMLAFCLATLLLALTAGTMWWKRRPAGGIGIPPWPGDRRTAARVTLIIVGLGALFPLTGLAILVMLGLDLAAQAVGRRLTA
jgi:uncharacterized iron-regulated membrane protein